MTAQPMLSFSRLLICTHNPHKLEEIRAMLQSQQAKLSLLSFSDFPDLPAPAETGDTFFQNALIKANAAFSHTGIPALADDSGLVVPALGGMPGVHSARYAGVDGPMQDQANRQKLIQAILTVPPEHRQAYFHCSLVLRWNEQEFHHVEGQCCGILLTTERGEHGFGYDPLFFLPEYQQTLAELSAQEKNRISHRARAMEALLAWWS